MPKVITYKQGQLVLDDATQESIDTLIPSANACEFQLLKIDILYSSCKSLNFVKNLQPELAVPA